MGRFGIVCSLVALTVMGAQPVPAVTMAPETDCDAMGASPLDLDLPRGVEGASFGTLSADDVAVTACLDAIEAYPSERRFYTHLGRIYAKGGAYGRSLEAYRKAFSRGSAIAANNLGAMYEAGNGVPQSDTRATYYYRKAAHRGLSFSMLLMAARAREGTGMIANMAMAAYWYELAADAGEAQGFNDLAMMHKHGWGVRQDDAKTVELLLAALQIDPGYALAAYNVAEAYEQGQGVEQDYAKAIEYYTISSTSGDGDGADAVGRLYAEGLGVDQDAALAVEWYARGAALGSMAASVSLADAYQDGLGIAANPAEARRLYDAALAYEPNDEWRDYIESRMTTLPEEPEAGSDDAPETEPVVPSSD